MPGPDPVVAEVADTLTATLLNALDAPTTAPAARAATLNAIDQAEQRLSPHRSRYAFALALVEASAALAKRTKERPA